MFDAALEELSDLLSDGGELVDAGCLLDFLDDDGGWGAPACCGDQPTEAEAALTESTSCDEPAAKRQRRLQKNRESAALSRSRKREQLGSLSARVAELEQQNRALSHLYGMLQMENMMLRQAVNRGEAETPVGPTAEPVHPVPSRITAAHGAPMLAGFSLLLLLCLCHSSCVSPTTSCGSRSHPGQAGRLAGQPGLGKSKEGLVQLRSRQRLRRRLRLRRRREGKQHCDPT